jgi:chorismate mutase
VVRGIRGATTVTKNDKAAILRATKELVLAIIEKNSLDPDDVASVFITSTPDLDATFPAAAVRSIPSWELVPLIGSTEVDVPGALSRCIRLMLLVNTEKSASEVAHVFLHEAVKLRQDLRK